MKEIKQGVSKFTEKDLTPLETHVQTELEKIQAGHEGYKVVPVELWDELQETLLIASAICVRNGYKETSKAFIELHERTNKI